MAEVWKRGHWVRVRFDGLQEDRPFRVVEPDGTLMMDGRVYIASAPAYVDARGRSSVICKPDGFVIKSAS